DGKNTMQPGNLTIGTLGTLGTIGESLKLIIQKPTRSLGMSLKNCFELRLRTQRIIIPLSVWPQELHLDLSVEVSQERY
ncbi:hypothetical protein BGZ65_000829, partial [Modicella reniformis]